MTLPLSLRNDFAALADPRVRHFISLGKFDTKDAMACVDRYEAMKAGEHCAVDGCRCPSVTELCQGHIEMWRAAR